MRSAGIAIAFILTLGSGTFAEAQTPTTPHWHTDLKAAQKQAIAEGKHLLIVFGMEGCVNCRRMEVTTFRNPTVQAAIRQKFVPVHLDYHRDEQARKILGVTAAPTSAVVTTDAYLLNWQKGYLKTPKFMRFLSEAIQMQSKIVPASASVPQR